MSKWYRAIVNDITKLPEALAYYEEKYAEAQEFLKLKGKSISAKSSEMPSRVDQYFGLLQELEAILEYLNIQLKSVRSSSFRKYLENYQRALSSRDCEKYSDSDTSVIDMAMLVNECSMIRNKYLSLSKGMEQMSWMIGHVVRLRTAGLDDATF